MPKATWSGAVIAPSDCCEIVEGNRYFPAPSVRRESLRPSDTHTACHWKGTCSCFDIVVEGMVKRDAAWYYLETKPGAAKIRG